EDLCLLVADAGEPRRRHRREPARRASHQTSGPLSAAATPASVLPHPAVAIAPSANSAGGIVTASAPRVPPGTRHGRGSVGAVARSARNAASSTRSGNEYSQMLRTISSLNENMAQTA